MHGIWESSFPCLSAALTVRCLNLSVLSSSFAALYLRNGGGTDWRVSFGITKAHGIINSRSIFLSCNNPKWISGFGFLFHYGTSLSLIINHQKRDINKIIPQNGGHRIDGLTRVVGCTATSPWQEDKKDNNANLCKRVEAEGGRLHGQKASWHYV